MIKKLSLPLTVLVCLMIGFGGGIIYTKKNEIVDQPIQQLVNQEEGKAQNIDFSLFWKVWNDLSAKYVDKDQLDKQKMVYGAIEGMVNSVGDPYTVFFEPVKAKAFAQEISGAFGGVGMEIGVKNNVLTVVAPLPNTPAARAGILAGDKILKIDGVTTEGVPADTAVSTIRGKVGTKVTVTIVTGTDKARDIVLTRETIKVPTVVWKMINQGGKNIAYIQAYQFNENINSQFKTAVDAIEKSNPKADGIILDLRNNPGGLLDSAINLAGYFVGKNQPVVSEVFGDGTVNNFKADGNSVLAKYKTVILVNGGSASASEILAGALHDDLHLKIVGEKTFGKGVVQELENLDAGASFKVTVARWFTPSGINISKKGIEPDIKVELTEEQKKNIIFGDTQTDPQLQKALDTFK
ncbi:MAG: S41 family peptidase [Candidatus Pacebacteria bacterium]|nr:S41 family peptidase [Candidatus Paceibacterota bacterium]